MGELAGQLEISRPQLTGLIDGLVRIGFVERTGGTTDRRVISVRLTPRAEEFLRQTQQEAFRRYSIRLDRLDEEEKALLLTSLQNVRRLLAKTETDDALPQKE